MIAFDTDVLTEVWRDNPTFVARAAGIPVALQAVPVVVIEEIIRGRLNVIRQAEAGKAKLDLAQAYELFRLTFSKARQLQMLAYDTLADARFRLWKQQGVHVSTHDLRIAAICVAQGAKLLTRNRRDFERIPGLAVDFLGCRKRSTLRANIMTTEGNLLIREVTLRNAKGKRSFALLAGLTPATLQKHLPHFRRFIATLNRHLR